MENAFILVIKIMVVLGMVVCVLVNMLLTNKITTQNDKCNRRKNDHTNKCGDEIMFMYRR